MSRTPKIISHISARPNVPNYLLDIRKFWWSRRNQDADLVLVSGMKSVHIHQAVILPLSSFLRGIIPSSCPCVQPAIILPPVPPDVLDALVELLYLGRSTAGSGDVEEKVPELLHLLWINVDIFRDYGKEEETVNESVANGGVPPTLLPSLSGKTQPNFRMQGRKRNIIEPDDYCEKRVRKIATDRDFKLPVKNPESSSTDHRNQKNKYCCDECDSKFTRKDTLKRHIESIHDDGKYPCDQCDYQGNRKPNLKEHIESIHAKVRYPCDECTYRATTKSALKRHVKTVHGKVTPASDQSNLRVTRKSTRPNHAESISGNAQYSSDRFAPRSTRNTRQLRRQTSKRVPDSKAVKKCSVRVIRLDRYQLGVRNCEVRIMRISPDERIAGGEIGQLTNLTNGTNDKIEDDETEEVLRNNGNDHSTALVSVVIGANEVIEEIPRDEDIEEIRRNDDVIRIVSCSVTITRKTRK